MLPLTPEQLQQPDEQAEETKNLVTDHNTFKLFEVTYIEDDENVNEAKNDESVDDFVVNFCRLSNITQRNWNGMQ